MLLSEAMRPLPHGTTYRQVDYWIRGGYVRVKQTGSGTGYPRTISDFEARVLLQLAHLVNAGVAPAAAARVARRVVRTGSARLGGLTISATEAA